MARRAYASEDKEARRRVILDAAADLFEQTRELPSVAEVAAAAGLAKGTVYLYFRTKGAIFADILLGGWGVVIDQLGEAFTAEGGRADKVARFLSGFVGFLDENPMILRLDAVVQALLERELEPDELATFKETLHRRLGEGGAVIEAGLGLPAGRGVQLLVRTHALTRGLWAYFDGPNIDAAFGLSDFAKDLSDALTEYWRGALASTPTEQELQR